MEKILAAGYYWPTMFKETFDYCKCCEVCQTFVNKSTVSGNLHPIPPLGPFEKWGIDLMGPLPVTKMDIVSLWLLRIILPNLRRYGL